MLARSAARQQALGRSAFSMPEYIWVSDSDLFHSFQRWTASTRCARRCAPFASTARISAKSRAVLAQLPATEYCTAARAVAVQPDHAIEDESGAQVSGEHWKSSYGHVEASREMGKGTLKARYQCVDLG